MSHSKNKQIKRERRHARVRARVFGTVKKPRLSVFRSLSYIYAQLIDDENGVTLASADSRKIKTKGEGKLSVAFEVGKLIAGKAADKKIKNVVFDRGGYKFHGRVKAVADGAREGGLEF